MTNQEYLTFFKTYQEKCHAYQLALSTMHFDGRTVAPKKGADYRNRMTAILEGDAFSYETNPKHLALIEEMAEIDFDELTNEAVKQTLVSLKRNASLPKEFFLEFTKAQNDSYFTWENAKHKNDYATFAPKLKKLIELSKQKAAYYNPNLSCYDVLLDEHETGMNVEKYDAFFQLIKDRLLPFIQRLLKEGKKIDDSVFFQNYPADKQAIVMEDLKAYMNYDPEVCMMGISEHPFTSPLSSNDVRMTTHYVENNLTSSIFSIIHEYGHAQYMLHTDPKFDGTILASNMSFGMHESQSRLMENYLSHRKSFWVNNFDQLKANFPDQLKEVDLDAFIKMINVAYPSYVRTEADELTYPIHILIRYEIEKAIFNDNYDCDKIEELWNQKMVEYLGICPRNSSEGILQDVHWSDASFGYFPTYALGSAYAAQFFKQMCKDLDVDQLLIDRRFDVITDWLTENIHRYGSSLNADAILEKLCHEKFDANVYVDYLIDKYSAIYELTA